MAEQNKTIEFGNLYEVNQQLIKDNEIAMTKESVSEKIKNIVIPFLNSFIKSDGQYLMLLCNDRKDYTVFHLNKNDYSDEEVANLANYIITVLTFRGQIYGITEKHSGKDLSFWIKINDEMYYYVLFDYGFGIAEV